MKNVFRAILALLLLPMVVFAETPVQVESVISGLTDSSGNPLAGGKIYTYACGTTTNKTTWQDGAKAVAHANPVVLDAEGKKLIFADGCYKFRIDSSADATLYTLDNLRFGLFNGGATYAGATTGSSSAYVATLSPALLALINGAQITFEANHTNTGAATLNVNGLGAIDLNRSNDTALTANEIISGDTYSAVYESSTNAWLLQNSSMPTWTTWVPTVTPEASMTYTATVTYAKYYRIGRLVYGRVNFTGTVAGTPADSMRVTLPVTATSDGITAYGSVLDNGSFASLFATSGSTTTIDLYRYDEAVYTAGTVTFMAYFFYEAAA